MSAYTDDELSKMVFDADADVRPRSADALRELLTLRHEARDRAGRIATALTDDVIRHAAILSAQRMVQREQDGNKVFITGMEAAREFLIEHLAAEWKGREPSS